MKKNIVFAIVLSHLMLYACGNEAITETPETTDTDVVFKETDDTFSVEKCDFGGAEFRILHPNWFLYNDYFFAEEQNGDNMNDAIWERTVKTEEHLGIKIKPICFGYIETIFPKVQEAVLSGDDAYDLALTHCISGVSNLALGDLLIDMKDLSNISFDPSYWNERTNTNLELGNKRLFAVSDFMLADPNVILFNKRLNDEYNLDDPYELIKTGTWTWDKLTEMSRCISEDLDGNGIYDENDLYGFAAQAEWKMISIMYSCGQYMVEKEEGEYKIAMNTEKMFSIVDKMNTLFNSSKSSFIWTAKANEMRTGIITDRVLFDLAALNDSAIYRSSEVDFGILPFPKYDEAQSDYISLDWCGLMCVPKSVLRPELAGKTLETFAYFSHDTTQPAYRIVLLGDKLARDEESIDILDIIFDGCVCDFGLNYLGFNDLTYTIPRLVARDKSTDYASWYQKNISLVESNLIKLTENFN